MKKDFIPYEEAIALKELGFDEECFSIFYKSNPKKIIFAHVNKSGKMLFQHNSLWDDTVGVIVTPTYQQVFRWFREKHNLLSWIEKYQKDEKYVYQIPNANFEKYKVIILHMKKQN